jgi:hypothetical protein
MALNDVSADELVHKYGSTVGDHAIRKIFRDELELPMTALNDREWTEMQIGIGPLVRYNIRRIMARLWAKEISEPRS